MSDPNIGAAAAKTFVDMACGAFPPHPPGWDEWWQKHRAEVAAAIEEAQASARRTLHYRVLQTLEALGVKLGFCLLPLPSGSVPSIVVRSIIDLLDESKDEPVHLRFMGGPPMPSNECSKAGDHHTEEPTKVTCEACRRTIGFERAKANIRIAAAQGDAYELARLGLEIVELKEKLKGAPRWCPGCGAEMGGIHVCGGRGASSAGFGGVGAGVSP